MMDYYHFFGVFLLIKGKRKMTQITLIKFKILSCIYLKSFNGTNMVWKCNKINSTKLSEKWLYAKKTNKKTKTKQKLSQSILKKEKQVYLRLRSRK